MEASSLTSRIQRWVAVQDWAWWRLRPLSLRWYVAAVPLAAATTIGIAAAYTDWRVSDLAKFVLFMVCAVVSMASTPRIAYANPGVTRDFTTMWVLPTAVLLPPVYAGLVTIPIFVTLVLFVHRGVVHRRVFSAGSISLSYMLASLVFRSFPASVAGSISAGTHGVTWVMVVALCYLIGSRVQRLLIYGAIKLTSPEVQIWRMEFNREAFQALFVEVDLGVLITLAVGISPLLVVVALPTVLVMRPFLVNPVLVAQSRVDSKTGLLNVSTWEAEAEVELSRSIRTRSALSVAIVDIDHFKRVNDTYGHLVGDRVLKAVADEFKGQLRDYDRAGRFGGEEFVLLLAQSGEDEATGIAERLRKHIGALAVPIDDRPDAPCVSITISIGVAAMERGQNHQLTDLLAAADSSLYKAKEAGRNRICVAQSVQHGQLVNEIATQMGLVQGDPAGASLCPAMSL